MSTSKYIPLIKDGDLLGISLAIHAKSKTLQKSIDDLLMVAVSYGQIDIATLFLEQGANINAQVNIWSYGNSPVSYALSCGNTDEVIRFLLDSGLDVDLPYKGGDTTLHHLARQVSTLDIWKSALSRAKNVNSKSDSSITPVHIAGISRMWEVVEYLIQFGADVNIQDKYGNTMLHSILLSEWENTREEDVKKMLDLGVHPDIKNLEGQNIRDLIARYKVPLDIQGY